MFHPRTTIVYAMMRYSEKLPSADENTVVLLLGNTGVGKSSVGCRLLGFEPGSDSDKPFKVVPSGTSVTLETLARKGTWFGKGDEPALTVVDTPGTYAFLLSYRWSRPDVQPSKAAYRAW